jgi:hypothetical protein
MCWKGQPKVVEIVPGRPAVKLLAGTKVVELDKDGTSLLNAGASLRSGESEFFPWLSQKST